MGVLPARHWQDPLQMGGLNQYSIGSGRCFIYSVGLMGGKAIVRLANIIDLATGPDTYQENKVVHVLTAF